MDPLTIAIASAIFGGTSATVGTANLLRQLRKIDTHRATRDALAQYKQVTNRSKRKSEEDMLLDCLALADVIAGPLRAKLINRFWLSLGVIAGSVALTLPQWSAELARIQRLGWPEVVVGIVLLVAGVVNVWPTIFLSADERAFLVNSRMLAEWFYDAYVPEAMIAFNRAVGGTTVIKGMIVREGLRTDRLKESVRKLFDDFKGLSEKHNA